MKERKPSLGENLNINDEKIAKHLDQENHWSRGEKIPTIFIEDFPNEKGYFCLWELSINDDLHSRRILPIFINDDMVFRPFAGGRIWDELLKDDVAITVDNNIYIEDEIFNKINQISQESAYDDFLQLKEEYEKKT